MAVASSAGGTRLVAASLSSPPEYSSDSGATWTPLGSAPGAFQFVTCNADCTQLAGGGNGPIYTSIDSGGTWVQSSSPSPQWQTGALSADGTRLVAATTFPALVYSQLSTTTLGTPGSLTGTQFQDLELQYLGSGLFFIASGNGLVTVQ